MFAYLRKSTQGQKSAAEAPSLPQGRLTEVDGKLTLDVAKPEYRVVASAAVSRAVSSFVEAQLTAGTFDPTTLRVALTAVAHNGIEVAKFGDALAEWLAASNGGQAQSEPARAELPIGAIFFSEGKDGEKDRRMNIVSADTSVGSL